MTASDASTNGGGVTASTELTPFGALASQCPIRGDIIENSDVPGVLTVGLFDGIAALRVAADVLQWNVLGHISVEKSTEAARVVERRFPSTIFVADVQSITLDMVKEWSTRFPQVSVILLGGGPPCQGVSGLNASKKGALKDSRSCLFTHVARIRELLMACFPWAQVRSLMESVASMSGEDEEVTSQSFGSYPWFIDAAGASLARRPRLYWIDWELQENVDCAQGTTPSGRKSITLQAELTQSDFVENRWILSEDTKLCTFTTSRPRSSPGYKPAGIHDCSPEEVERWVQDRHRFPPYQYKTMNLLHNKHGQVRLPSIREREVMMGFPRDYTMNCVQRRTRGLYLTKTSV